MAQNSPANPAVLSRTDALPRVESMPLGQPKVVQPDGRAPAPAPGNDTLSMLTGTIGPLALVLALIGVLAVLMRAWTKARGGLAGGGLGLWTRSLASGRAPSGVLSVLGRFPMGSGLSLVLLKLDRRVLLVTQTKAGRFGGASMSTLAEITDPDEVASLIAKCSAGEAAGEAFRAALRAQQSESDIHPADLFAARQPLAEREPVQETVREMDPAPARDEFSTLRQRLARAGRSA